MKKQDFFNLGLPKWPALIVIGDPVSREAAAEIIVRTDSLYFSTNDHKFSTELNAYLYDVSLESESRLNEAIRAKLGLEENDFFETQRYMARKRAEVGQIEGISYLNNSRIVSSWIGGPHGWCDWEGNIRCSNYNIGKWPDVKTVYEEWVAIAKEFPFLNLRAQLMNAEAGDGGYPVVEFVVSRGKVRMKENKNTLCLTEFGIADMYKRFTNPHAERGCSLEIFKNTVDNLRKKFAQLQTEEYAED